MKEVVMKKLAFGSILKLFVLASTSIGISIGVVMFFITVVLGYGYVELAGISFYGFEAGALAITLIPLIFLLIGVASGIIAYIPFLLLLKIFKKIKIEGQFIDYIPKKHHA